MIVLYEHKSKMMIEYNELNFDDFKKDICNVI